jgi:hypothetical protein
MEKNMTKLSRDLSAGTLHARENLFASGNINALNGEVICDADGACSAVLVVGGTYVGTIVLEGSADGTNWDAVPIKPINNGGVWLMTLASAAVGRWHGPAGVFRKIRARMSAYTSGTATIYLAADNGVSDIQVSDKACDLYVTGTAVVNTAVTLTLPAVAGMYHFIRRIELERHATALLTAAATPTIITTTNLPGGRAFSIPVEAAAQGSVYSKLVEGGPFRSAAAGVASTIVAAALPLCIWRMSVDYYVAPA